MSPNTEHIQKLLADYCRTGTISSEIPGAKTDRLPHYRRLVFNVINDALEQAYPITHNILSEKEWSNLIQDFFVHHDSTTPQLWKMPYQLYLYVKNAKYHKKLKRPYLLDLLYFEWIEIEVYCMPDEDMPNFMNVEDFTDTDILVFNPECQIIPLEYPVHKLNRMNKKQLKTPSSYYVLVYRDFEEKNVHFLDLGQYPAILLAYLMEEVPFKEAVDKTAEHIGIRPSKEQILGLRGFIQVLKENKFYLGIKNK